MNRRGKSPSLLMKMNKTLKYSLLRCLPGRLGRRYQRKLERLHARTFELEEAIKRVKDVTCIDLGANVGVHTKRFASIAKQVIAFEPDPYILALLRANVADLDNVKIVNAAASTSEGVIHLYRHVRFDKNPEFYSRSSSIVSSKNNVKTENAVEVRQVDFIKYLEDLDEDIGILKIDIEGAEVELLEALFNRPDIMKRIDYIFAETHENRIPGHEQRVNALRKLALEIKRPRINLDWQ